MTAWPDSERSNVPASQLTPKYSNTTAVSVENYRILRSESTLWKSGSRSRRKSPPPEVTEVAGVSEVTEEERVSEVRGLSGVDESRELPRLPRLPRLPGRPRLP